MVKKLYVVIAAAVISILVVISVVLFILYKRNWPVKFSLLQSQDNITVDIYANDMAAFSGQNLKAGIVTAFTIDDNVHNLRTNKPLTRHQLTSITVYLSQPASIKFSSINVPKHTVILSNDQSGFSVISSNVTGIWTQAEDNFSGERQCC